MNKLFKMCLVTLVVLIPALYLGAAFYSLSRSDIQYLLIYSLHPETHRHPQPMVRWYFKAFRGHEADLEFLARHNGLGFIVAMEHQPRARLHEYMAFFLDRGFDIDAVGIDGFTALHAAVLYNHLEDVEFLLARGACANVPVGLMSTYRGQEPSPGRFHGLDALELARALSMLDGRDRGKILTILRDMPGPQDMP